jgi:hypothetical protein
MGDGWAYRSGARQKWERGTIVGAAGAGTLRASGLGFGVCGSGDWRERDIEAGARLAGNDVSREKKKLGVLVIPLNSDFLNNFYFLWKFNYNNIDYTQF